MDTGVDMVGVIAAVVSGLGGIVAAVLGAWAAFLAVRRGLVWVGGVDAERPGVGSLAALEREIGVWERREAEAGARLDAFYNKEGSWWDEFGETTGGLMRFEATERRLFWEAQHAEDRVESLKAERALTDSGFAAWVIPRLEPAPPDDGKYTAEELAGSSFVKYGGQEYWSDEVLAMRGQWDRERASK